MRPDFFECEGHFLTKSMSICLYILHAYVSIEAFVYIDGIELVYMTHFALILGTMLEWKIVCM